MKYIFEINIYTDADFGFQYVPRGMEYDGSLRYNLIKTYNNRDEAMKDILDICSFLKETVHSHKTWVKESWREHVDSFSDKLKNSNKTKHEEVEECMYGNYDGTFLLFRTEDDYINCGFYATEEEIELIKSNHEGITNAMIKEAVLNLFRKNTK